MTAATSSVRYGPGWCRCQHVAQPHALFVLVTCNVGCVAHRQRLREQGLRPIQIWVPDVRSPQFVEQAHSQSLAVASSQHEADDQAFIDALTEDE